jgi:hypothetical protein
LIIAPVSFSVDIVAIAVIAIVIVAKVPNLALGIPVIGLALAVVALRGAEAVVAISHIPIAVSAVGLGAPITVIVWVSHVPIADESIFVYWIVLLSGVICPVISSLPDEGLIKFEPWCQLNK